MENYILKGKKPIDELTNLVNEELQIFLKKKDSNFQWPQAKKNLNISKGDFTLLLSAICGKYKINAKEFTANLAKEFNEEIEKNDKKKRLIHKAEASAGYLNLFLNKPLLFKMILKNALFYGEEYGKLDIMKGKKVIIEHTSANPIGPLHIGNLRNVILGGVLSEILKSVGYEVKQHFYVNDLGAQIGLTAIGFSRIFDKIEPKLKIDQWIGMIYAIMNTFSELQQNGQDLTQIDNMIKKEEDIIEKVKNDPNIKIDKLKEYISIYKDLQKRQPELFSILLNECKSIPNIKKEASELNLQYESNKSEAVKIFRKMVISCLTGIQETLDIYNIKHDQFDFESELGWEGSNDRVLTVIKASPYFVEPTSCNKQGKPEGGYFNLDKFIKDKKLPQGKKGYQPNYPHLYVFRPDGSTLYTFRDVVYSLKKVSNADMVLNIIAAEQNLAQEKVSLSLQLLLPGEIRKQFHVSYELVKLLDKDNNERKMSSRRGIYVLADDIYDELREAVTSLMTEKFKEKGKEIDKKLFEEVTNEISTAAMKYALISVSCNSKLNFNLEKAADPKDSSAPFLLYNATRFFSLFRKYEDGVKNGIFPSLPSFDLINWDVLTSQFEWELLNSILEFPSLIYHIACPTIPEPPALPEFPIHLLCDFEISLVRLFSKYWGATKVLTPNPSEEESTLLFARLYLLKGVQLILNNGLKILTMKPLERM